MHSHEIAAAKEEHTARIAADLTAGLLGVPHYLRNAVLCEVATAIMCSVGGVPTHGLNDRLNPDRASIKDMISVLNERDENSATDLAWWAENTAQEIAESEAA